MTEHYHKVTKGHWLLEATDNELRLITAHYNTKKFQEKNRVQLEEAIWKIRGQGEAKEAIDNKDSFFAILLEREARNKRIRQAREAKKKQKRKSPSLLIEISSSEETELVQESLLAKVNKQARACEKRTRPQGPLESSRIAEQIRSSPAIKGNRPTKRYR